MADGVMSDAEVKRLVNNTTIMTNVLQHHTRMMVIQIMIGIALCLPMLGFFLGLAVVLFRWVTKLW